jgi:hypothetical protein
MPDAAGKGGIGDRRRDDEVNRRRRKQQSRQFIVATRATRLRSSLSADSVHAKRVLVASPLLLRVELGARFESEISRVIRSRDCLSPARV